MKKLILALVASFALSAVAFAADEPAADATPAAAPAAHKHGKHKMKKSTKVEKKTDADGASMEKKTTEEASKSEAAPAAKTE